MRSQGGAPRRLPWAILFHAFSVKIAPSLTAPPQPGCPSGDPGVGLLPQYAVRDMSYADGDVRAPSTNPPHSSLTTYHSSSLITHHSSLFFHAAVATALGRMTVSAKRSISSSCGLHC